jgi:putative transposase
MLLSEGQMSDFKGAALMLPAMPKARQLLADKGYDADGFRAAHRRLHPFQVQPESRHSPRRRPLQTAPQNREHVRKAQGLATPPHPIRPLRPHLLLGNLHRRSRHLLALINES